MLVRNAKAAVPAQDPRRRSPVLGRASHVGRGTRQRLDGRIVHRRQFDDECLNRRRHQPIEDVEHQVFPAVHDAVAVACAIVQDDIAPSKSRRRKRHVGQPHAGGIETRAPDDFTGAIGVEANGGPPQAIVRGIGPARILDAALLPRSPGLGPPAEGRGRDAAVPPGALVVGGQFGRAPVELQRLLPAAPGI